LDKLKAQEDKEWQPAIEKALVVAIQASPTPIGEAIRALAWLRKGATPELLAQVMGLQTADGEWDVYTAAGYLDEIAQLALVKVRPGDRRIFLHDEMCTLLQKHVLRKSSQEERDHIYSAVQAYYRDLTSALERRSEQLPPELASTQSHLRQALVEEMHYRLRQNPPIGFAMYFWLAEEALGGRDAEMDMLVRTEFLRTLAMLKENDQLVGPLPREAEVDIAVRWGMRVLFLQGNPEAALSIFDQIRRRWGRQAGKLGLAWVHLQLCRAAARIQRSRGDDWQEAQDQLVGVVKAADEILATPPENPVVKARRWRARILKGLALNYLGYLDRQQGRYLEAVRHYQESAMLQRRLGMAALAPTLTNLSYVMTLTGACHHARLLAEEAERLARRKGKQHVLALTLNVRALVEAYDDHHRAALRYTDRALEAAADLPSQRVRGLIYLTRARVHRYLWNSITDTERRREPTFFDEALKEANQALSLLRDGPADKVEALLERGCIYRELARLYHGDGKIDEADEFASRSRSDLERVALLAAAINLPRHQALACTDLGWLFYYLGKGAEAQQALDQACQVFPPEYLFPPQGPLPPLAQPGRKAEATLPFWSTLGKAEMLRAYLSLDQALAASGQDRVGHLQTAVRHITLSLAYDKLIADTYFDLSRAEEGLHKRIIHDGLSIKALHHYASQAAEAQGLQPPTHLQAFLGRLFGSADLWA
jgi:tetratricopeptide (TPR) repeat protein